MVGVTEGTTAPSRDRVGQKRRRVTTLSVCCMTSGRRPALLAGVLASLRSVADEIVVAVEATRAADVHSAVAGVADRVIAFPQTFPADRPIAWLFRSCSGTWIFNVDDDEIPSPALVAALPELVRRTGVRLEMDAREAIAVCPECAGRARSAFWIICSLLVGAAEDAISHHH